jgi:hypothetical protein
MGSSKCMHDHQAPSSGPLLASIARLEAPSLLGMVVHDEATGEGRLPFGPSYSRALQAGGSLFVEPGGVAAWMTADPLVVRPWVEREAAVLDGQPAGAAAGTTEGSREQRGSR